MALIDGLGLFLPVLWSMWVACSFCKQEIRRWEKVLQRTTMAREGNHPNYEGFYEPGSSAFCLVLVCINYDQFNHTRET